MIKKVKSRTILVKLESVAHRAIIPKVPKSFFPLLHEFGISLLLSSELKESIIIILDKEKKVIEYIETFKKAALDELIEYEIKIRSYSEINNIYNPELTYFLDEFQSHLKIAEPLINNLRFKLERALDVLLHDNRLNHDIFLTTFGEIKQINDYRYFSNAFPKCNAWQNETLYVGQIKSTTDWYGLKQIMAFFERYDFRHNDRVISELTKKGLEISQLQDESIALMKHVISEQEMPSDLFPTIEEYKSYMMKVVESIKEILDYSTEHSEKHLYSYDPESAELQIDDDTCIEYKVNQDPARLLKLIKKFKKRSVTFVQVYNELWTSAHDRKKKLEPEDIDAVNGVIRQVNSRVKDQQKPKFLKVQESKINLKQYDVLITTSYKSR